MTDLPAERPPDFHLSTAWQQVVDEMEQRRSLVSATVLIHARFVPVLQSQFGRHCEVVDRLDDGRVRARVAAHTARGVAEQVAGWGATIEAPEPESVRAELARIGSVLAQRYAT